MALSPFHPAVRAWFEASFPGPTAAQTKGWAPIARGELLHFRDDDHLNPRGHEATARILADHLRELDAARQP